MHIKELIKESFHLWCKMRWLKMIDRENEKYRKLQFKIKAQSQIIHDLLKRYNELYGELLTTSDKK